MRESVATARVTIGFLRLIFKINRDTMSQDNQPSSEQRSTTDDDGSLSSLGLKVPVVPATNDAAADTVPALENLDNNLDTATSAQQLHQSDASEPAQHANLGNISYFNYIQLLKFYFYVYFVLCNPSTSFGTDYFAWAASVNPCASRISLNNMEYIVVFVLQWGPGQGGSSYIPLGYHDPLTVYLMQKRFAMPPPSPTTR